MFLNDKEKIIIEEFYTNIEQYEKEVMLLSWSDGSYVVSSFDTCFEDDNDCDMDDKNYEEYTTFVFKCISLSGNPPICVTEDNYFCVNYHNFPDKIISNGKKIN